MAHRTPKRTPKAKPFDPRPLHPAQISKIIRDECENIRNGMRGDPLAVLEQLAADVLQDGTEVQD
jgi:hypothetical protein